MCLWQQELVGAGDVCKEGEKVSARLWFGRKGYTLALYLSGGTLRLAIGKVPLCLTVFGSLTFRSPILTSACLLPLPGAVQAY